MQIAVYDCKYSWADGFTAGWELVQALEDDISSGDAAMTLVEPSIAVASLEQWLEDFDDEEEFPDTRARVATTIGELKALGEDTYVALNC